MHDPSAHLVICLAHGTPDDGDPRLCLHDLERPPARADARRFVTLVGSTVGGSGVRLDALPAPGLESLWRAVDLELAEHLCRYVAAVDVVRAALDRERPAAVTVSGEPADDLWMKAVVMEVVRRAGLSPTEDAPAAACVALGEAGHTWQRGGGRLHDGWHAEAPVEPLFEAGAARPRLAAAPDGLHVVTLGHPFEPSRALPPGEIDAMRVRMRTIGCNGVDIGFGLGDGEHAQRVRLEDGHVTLGGARRALDTAVEHDYVLVVRRGNAALFVDGRRFLTSECSPDRRPRVTWGHGKGGGDAESCWRYVEWGCAPPDVGETLFPPAATAPPDPAPAPQAPPPLQRGAVVFLGTPDDFGAPRPGLAHVCVGRAPGVVSLDRWSAAAHVPSLEALQAAWHGWLRDGAQVLPEYRGVSLVGPLIAEIERLLPVVVDKARQARALGACLGSLSARAVTGTRFDTDLRHLVAAIRESGLDIVPLERAAEPVPTRAARARAPLDVIYYENLDDVDRFLEARVGDEDVSYFVDAFVNHARCRTPLHCEDDANEEALRTIFDESRRSNPLRLAMIHEYLVSHYPRLVRWNEAFARAEPCRRHVAFIDRRAMNVFDLAMGGARASRWFSLQGEDLIATDPRALVEWYDPSGAPLPPSPAPAETAAIAPGRSRDVLFVAYDTDQGYYLRAYFPIFEELAARDIPFTILSCGGRAARHLDARGLSHMPVALDAERPDDREIAAVTASVWTPHPRGLFDEVLNLTVNTAHVTAIVQTVKTARRIDLTSYTDVFLAPDGTPLALQLAPLARRLGLATHTVLAGDIADTFRSLAWYLADHIYCHGLESQAILRKHFPDRTLHLAGRSTLWPYEPGRTAPIEGLAPRVILVATSGYDDAETVWMRALLAHVDSAQCTVLVKPHPMYPDRYACLADSLHGHRLLEASFPIEGCVAQADLIITDHSQVGKDAHLMGKPVISVTLTKPALYFTGVPTVTYCREVETLLESVAELSSGARKTEVDRDFVDQFNWGGSTRYYARVVDILLGLA